MRPIDADAIIETLNSSRWQDQSWIAKHHWAHAVQLKDYIVDALTVAPTINPEDLRPEGKWIASKLGYLCCSECHDAYVDPEWIAGGKWKYCPNCGAKMEE